MRRLVAICCLAFGLPPALVFGLGAAGGPDGYRVRAIFDNAAAAVPGEDVRVAGARVGVIESMDVTEDKKAVVVLRIEDGRFAPFRADARCTVRPQSLIGEKFVECQPGRSRRTLQRVDDGQHLLPLARTSSPVDLDLVNDVLRLPARERLTLLLNEFGTGLAGRGADLNEAIHRANPALRDTDRVLSILARQNRTLARLASDSDAVLGPLARERRRLGGFVEGAGRTAEATAERRADIARSVRRLPAFLAQLRPLMSDLGSFTRETTPVARDLNAAAPDVSRLIRELGPFSTAAGPAVRSLGRATVRGRPALVRARPLVRDLRRVARDARPVSSSLDSLTRSLDRTGGIERLMDYLFFQMTAINGFDGIGHYLRAGLLVNLCSTYSTVAVGGCNSNFGGGSDDAGAAVSGPRDRTLARLGPALANALRDPKGGSTGSSGEGSVPRVQTMLPGLVRREDPATARARERSLRVLRERADGTPGGRGEPLLDYLLGGRR